MPKYAPEGVVDKSSASTDPRDLGPEALEKNAYYIGVQPRDLNPLDLIARQIIAYRSSMKDPKYQNPVTQALRDIETVACAVVGKDTLLIAHNYKFFDPTLQNGAIKTAAIKILESLYSEGCTNITKHKVLYSETNFHAEMKIIQYCVQNNVPIKGAVIGVSKPCCQKCAKVLDKLKIDYSLYNEVPIGYWLSPGVNWVPTSSGPAL